jgi:hypothetical protein
MKVTLINDNHELIDIVNCICFDCRHFDNSEIKCSAFGIDIPLGILSGKSKHSKPVPGQKNEIVFEPIKLK